MYSNGWTHLTMIADTLASCLTGMQKSLLTVSSKCWCVCFRANTFWLLKQIVPVHLCRPSSWAETHNCNCPDTEHTVITEPPGQMCQSVSGMLDRPRVVAPSKTCGHVRSSRRRWRSAQCRPRSAAPTFGRVVLAGASTPAWCQA